jgi:hypothetical protein
MKKFILSFLLLTFITGVFHIISVLVWSNKKLTLFEPNVNYKIGYAGHLYSRISEVKNQKDIDILFLGSSRTYRGFDTRIFSKFGFRTFNLGSSGQTPIQTNLLLNRYLEILNPKTVIMEVNPLTFSIDGVESSLDIIANDRNDLYSLGMVLKLNNIKTYNTYLVGLVIDLFNINKAFIELPLKGTDTYIPGGFVEKEMDYNDVFSFPERLVTIDENQLEQFSKIISKLQNNNTTIILVYAPIPNTYYKSYSNIKYFDSLMVSYSEYYNFNKTMTLNDSLHFYDQNHLNQNGVRLFNNKLIELLKARSSTNEIGELKVD